MANKFPSTYETWKKQAASYALERLGLDDIFAEDDPYELAASGIEAFEAEISPKAFVREVFAEDMAAKLNDEQMVRKARRRGDIF